MAAGTSASTTFGISATLPGSHDAAGFGALSFTLVGEISDHGQHGREYTLVTHKVVASRGTDKYKGSFNEGSKAIQLAIDTADSGQSIVEAAVDSDNNYAFREVYPDGSIDYFLGKVMSFQKNVGAADNMIMGNVAIELTTSNGLGIVRV